MVVGDGTTRTLGRTIQLAANTKAQSESEHLKKIYALTGNTITKKSGSWERILAIGNV